MNSSDDFIALVESCSGNQCCGVTVSEKIDFIVNNVAYFENQIFANVIKNNILNIPIHTQYDLDRFCKAIYDAQELMCQMMLGNTITMK